MNSVKRLLFGHTRWCYKCQRQSRRVIVRSRTGGFVTQNCEHCGKPDSISQQDLSQVSCGKCGTVQSTGKSHLGNYVYSCPSCQRTTELHQLVPHWNELYEYDGFGLDSDDSQARVRESAGARIAAFRLM